MAASAIQWTDRVWNPVIGCTRVSPGCEHCYAETFAHRLPAMHQAEYEGLTHKHGGGSVNWTGVVRTLPDRLEEPLRWRKPSKVFVNSMSDLFHEAVPDDFILQVFGVMAEAERHTFQILTKRPERMRWLLTQLPGEVCYESTGCIVDEERFPLPNVWLGVSVENQAAADERIPLLLQTPAAVRFLSCEPLLGELNLWRYLNWPGCSCDGEFSPCDVCDANGPREDLHWVITGGESGPKGRWLVSRCSVAETEAQCCLDAPDGEKYCARCEPNGWGLKTYALDWLRSIRDQCRAAGVAYFHKQNGGPTNHAGGRLLDGCTWDQFPQTAVVA